MKRKYIKTLAFGMALTCAVPAMAQNKVVDLVLALPTIWSFLRFQPDFWLNIAVFLHIRF